MRMRRIILSSVACPALLHISTLNHKPQHFRGWGVVEHKMCFYFYSFCLTFLTQRRIQRYRTINTHSGRYSCHIPMKLEICRQNFETHTDVKLSWKSDQWEPSCSKRTDGRTWRRSQSLFEILRTRLKTPSRVTGNLLHQWRRSSHATGTATNLKPSLTLNHALSVAPKISSYTTNANRKFGAVSCEPSSPLCDGDVLPSRTATQHYPARRVTDT